MKQPLVKYDKIKTFNNSNYGYDLEIGFAECDILFKVFREYCADYQSDELLHTFEKILMKPSFLFRGFSATFTREVPGFAIYFSVYESLKHHYHSKHGREIGYLHAFLYGGISGVSAWIFIYPQDRIKTILQSSNSNILNNRGAFLNVIHDIYKKGGLKHFYSGFSWAVMRAILLHSGTFSMMEILNR
jgi:hypothetical protein